MAEELGQISFYLAKNGNTFDSVLQEENVPEQGDDFKIRSFSFDGAEIRFYCKQATASKPNPPWLDFVNEQITEAEDKISFDTFSRRPSGVLLIKLEDHILAATFGASGRSFLDHQKFLPDFGIKTAMNMCGNTEVRQTKSRTHAITTKQIDRQLSQPSDAFDFGLGESELLKFISAQLADNNKVTLQGKDSLTVKVLGSEKLSWERLTDYCRTFLVEYGKDLYKELFPNYPNFQEISEEQSNKLDSLLIERIKTEEFSRIHLAIPEFIADDQFSFSYSNFPQRENIIVSHLEISHFKNPGILDLDDLDIKKVKSKKIYAYSHEESKILAYRSWSLYSCIVYEEELDEEYFILSDGEWKKVDGDFYSSINEFIETVLVEKDIPQEFHDIDISVPDKMQNREDVFNETYVSRNENALLFDKAKLRIGQSQKDKEFCDILELIPEAPMSIIHVKKHGGSSAINYLFSQSSFYCEFFLRDETFLSEIRGHIEASDHTKKEAFLEHIKEDLSDVSGKEYEVGHWILYDSARGAAPTKQNLPLMAKYEIKLSYERLRNLLKYSAVTISMVPVKQVNFQTLKRNS